MELPTVSYSPFRPLPSFKNPSSHPLVKCASMIIHHLNVKDAISFYLCNKEIKIAAIEGIKQKIDDYFRQQHLSKTPFIKEEIEWLEKAFLLFNTFSVEDLFPLINLHLKYNTPDQAFYFIQRCQKKQSKMVYDQGFRIISNFLFRQQNFERALDVAQMISNLTLREEQIALLARSAFEDHHFTFGYLAASCLTLAKNRQDVEDFLTLKKMEKDQLFLYLTPIFSMETSQLDKVEKLKTAIQHYLLDFPLNLEPYATLQLNHTPKAEEIVYNLLFFHYLTKKIFLNAFFIALLFSPHRIRSEKLLAVLNGYYQSLGPKKIFSPKEKERMEEIALFIECPTIKEQLSSFIKAHQLYFLRHLLIKRKSRIVFSS